MGHNNVTQLTLVENLGYLFRKEDSHETSFDNDKQYRITEFLLCGQRGKKAKTNW